MVKSGYSCLFFVYYICLITTVYGRVSGRLGNHIIIYLFVLFKQSLPFRSYQAGTKFPSSIKTVLTLPELRQVAVPQIPLPCLPRHGAAG